MDCYFPKYGDNGFRTIPMSLSNKRKAFRRSFSLRRNSALQSAVAWKDKIEVSSLSPMDMEIKTRPFQLYGTGVHSVHVGI